MSWTHFRDDKIDRSRKKYRCVWCGEFIDIGSSYTRRIGVYEGELSSNPMHEECVREANKWNADDWEDFEHYLMKRPDPIREE